tara:strand:- start:3951 stop:4985 length:1035 start_codon:yes stop_codon:yes gene_type:complete
MLLIIILIIIIIISLLNVCTIKENLDNNTIQDCIVKYENDYTECTEPCGGGWQELKRKSVSGSEYGGECQQELKRKCNEQPCPKSCEIEISDWSKCKKNGVIAKCGGGTQYRKYNIIRNAVSGYKNGVKTEGECKYNDGHTETRECNTKSCAVDCIGSWSEWGECDKETGKRTSTYYVKQYPKDGWIHTTLNSAIKKESKKCPYKNGATRTKKCPVDCELTDWVPDGHNWTLGKDGYYRSIRIEPKNGGKKCESKYKWVNKPIHCEGYWEDNGECEDYWKKQKYTIWQENNGTGNACPHNNGDVKTLRPGIHTCSATHHTWCSRDSWLGCLWTSSSTTYAPNGL